MHMHMHIHMYTHIRAYTYMNIHMHTHIHAYTHAQHTKNKILNNSMWKNTLCLFILHVFLFKILKLKPKCSPISVMVRKE